MDISTVLVALAQALREKVEENGPLCFCGVVPGAQTAIEYAGDCGDSQDGMAWVRLAQSYPATGVGIASQRVGNCGASLGFDLEVGVVRSIDVSEEAPTEQNSLAWVERQFKDMQAARAAIACGVLHNKDFILGEYVPFGPEGGMVGGAWTVYVMV